MLVLHYQGEPYRTLDGAITRDNYKAHFNKGFKGKHIWDKRTNTDTGPTLHSEMRRFGGS